MIEKYNNRKELENKLKEVNYRLEILKMIETKLLKMRELAQRVVEEDLTERDIKIIDNNIQKLVKEIELLNSQDTKLS